jgi:rifampicin phosphotransferase
MATEPGTITAAALTALCSDSEPAAMAELAGGKARGLHTLTRMGVPVPPWAVVGIDTFRRFLVATELDASIEGELAGLGAAPDDRALTAAAQRIGDAIRTQAIGGDLQAALAQAYRQVGEGAVAVRSSAPGEDGGRLSFAGQHETLLNVVGLDAVTAAVKACWASAWSAGALRYRLINGLPLQGIEMAVVIQLIVAAEKSGVLFTVNPTNGHDDELIVSASHGLGQAIVSGSVDPDTFVLERTTGVVRETRVGAKEQRIDLLAQGGCQTRLVTAAARSALSLSPAELAELHQQGMLLERLMGSPQDVEWALAGGRLWVLQSRPITAGLRPADAGGGKIRLWDNSNIIESYGEMVAPLTYSFARHVYHEVYREYCELLGVPRRQLEAMDEWLANMLGYFDGRVYYNLLNWYRVVRLIPFYAVNRRVLEISIGSEPLDDDLAAQQQPLSYGNRGEAAAVRILIAIRFAWCFLTIHRMVSDFTDHFYRVYGEFDTAKYAGRSAHELYSMFEDMERRLLVRWGRMIALEASIGLAFGALHVLTQRWLSEAPEWFLYEAVKVTPDVESLQPLQRLDAIAAAIAGDGALHEQVRSLPAERLDATLRSARGPSARAVVELIDAYLDEFGDRNANELKLEEPDLREDPATFFALVKGAVERVATDTAEGPEQRPSADAYLAAHLRGWRRPLYDAVRRRVQRSLADRERVRFCRTRIFGLSRRMFRAMGEDLTRIGALQAPDNIFYLRLEELRGCFEGTIAHREVTHLVSLRMEQERHNRRRRLPARFLTRGGVYWDALDRAWMDAFHSEAPDAASLAGTPCSPGVVSGEAQLIDRPVDVGGRVLVTYRTDPGWVSVLRSASALLIERGSPLTHVAVVARELGIPTVVQIPGLTRRVHSGMQLTVDGGTGKIELSDNEEAGDGRAG